MISKWWKKLSPEMSFALWFSIWYTPLMVAIFKRTVLSWMLFAVIFSVCVVWFIADTINCKLEEERARNRKLFQEQTRRYEESIRRDHCERV